MNADPALVSVMRRGTCLIVSIHTPLDDAEMTRLQNYLSVQIGHRTSRAVIIDVAALDVVDSFATMTLRSISKQARLGGATIVIVGIQPDVAFAMMTLGLVARDMRTDRAPPDRRTRSDRGNSVRLSNGRTRNGD